MKNGIRRIAAPLALLILPMLCGAIIRLPVLTDIEGNWAESAITQCAERGIVTGYDDATYRPSAPITRAEFIKMTCAAFFPEEGAETLPGEVPFTDVSGHWAEHVIGSAYREGIVLGVSGDLLMPDRSISRQDAVLILSRVERRLGTILPESTPDQPFMDEEYVRAECAEAVRHFRMAGVIAGKTGNLFDPIGPMTRAEAAKCIILTIRGFETPQNSVNQ
jgi:hypothetical protein